MCYFEIPGSGQRNISSIHSEGLWLGKDGKCSQYEFGLGKVEIHGWQKFPGEDLCGALDASR